MTGLWKVVCLVALAQLLPSVSGRQPHWSPGSLLPAECQEAFFAKGEWLHLPCWKSVRLLTQLLSRLLSLAVILGSVIVKVPQILKILQLRSVAGLSFYSVALELICNILLVAYNLGRRNPFSSYGEVFFLALQLLFIFGFFFIFDKPTLTHFLVALGTLLLLLACFQPLLNPLVEQALHLHSPLPLVMPESLFANIIFLQTVLSTGRDAVTISRLMQIVAVERQKYTGSLAFLTVFLSFLGNVARVYTSFLETPDDWKSQLNFAVTTCLNGYISCLFLRYPSKPPKASR